MELYENLQRAARKFWKQVDSDTLNMICHHPQCHANCTIGVEPESLRPGHVFAALVGLPFILIGSVVYAAYLGGRTMVSFFRGNATQAPPPRKVCNCGHPDEDHSLRKSLWKQRDTNWVIDEGAEKRYDEAKRKNDENSKIMVDIKHIIASLDERIQQELALVRELVESYASLSLAGSFAIQVKKAIKYMKVNLEAMRNNTSDPKLVETVEESLEIMKNKLIVVEVANQR